MSKETLDWLNSQVLIGHTEKRGTAWHYRHESQGAEPNHYPRAIPPEDVIRRLFSWQAIQSDLSATFVDGDSIVQKPIHNYKAILRSDNHLVLGIHSEKYRIHQFDEWLLSNVGKLVGGDLSIGSAGLLDGGKRAWVQIEMSENVITKSGVEFRPFLTAATSMDGSIATTYLTGAQVVVCDNTLAIALEESDSKIKIKHSMHSGLRIEDAQKALSLISLAAESFVDQVDSLSAEFVSDETWREFTSRLTQPANSPASTAQLANQRKKIFELNELWNHDPRVAPWNGSVYGVIAAVNTWTHHFKTVKNTSRGVRNMDMALRGQFDIVDKNTLKLLRSIM
jgi:phage/plasmid-like protein (TIGR03299 family)